VRRDAGWPRTVDDQITMKDPYRVLNVAPTADQTAIKQAYRKLAKTLHPDRNPGNVRAEQRFKEVTQAYQLLSDRAKRARFDRGEIDGDGQPRRDFTFRGFGGSAGPRDDAARGQAESLFEKVFGGGFAGAFGRGFGAGGPSGQANASVEDLLRGRARTAGRGASAGQKPRGADRRYRLEIGFLDAARGGKQRLHVDSGRTLELDVPAGCESGKVLRLKGQGQASVSGGPAGDALVEIVVQPHPQFSRQGQDIQVELPISLSEAVLGARVTVPTIDGPVRITVPAGANTGRTLRLKGKGIAGPGAVRGDQYVRLLVMLPDSPDPDLESWARRHAREVRRDERKG
jgi:DnaJ-class molecular chaperone